MCRACGRTYPDTERFCSACGLPLVQGPGIEHPASRREQRARKIKPQYADGELVKVAQARNQIQAEFIEGLLLEEGIPCVLRAQIGGYAPLIGPREVLVPSSGAQAAREALTFTG